MSAIGKRLIRFFQREEGPTAVKHSVLPAPIVVCLVANSAAGQVTSDTFSTVGDKLKASAG